MSTPSQAGSATTGTGSRARVIIDRFHAAFNARDFAASAEILDEDVEFIVDAGSFRGREAALAFLDASARRLPGVVVGARRVAIDSGDTIVVEYQLVNPDPAQAWRLDGTVCEIFVVRDDRIVAVRTYYSPSETDRTEVAQVPSRIEAARIGDEQTALRRVATLVARGASEEELFAVVNRDLAGLVEADITSLMRFEPDDTITLLAAWGGQEADFPVGDRRPIDAGLRAARDSGRPTRSDDTELPAAGPFVEEVRRLGIRSWVGVPIVVEGRVWGMSVAASLRSAAFADDTESRMTGFTELVATALANAQARSELRRLADEQSALRRVAELVARGGALDEVFVAVVGEASALLGGRAATLLRYDDQVATVVAVSNGEPPPGVRIPVDDGNPIVVEGRSWGALWTGSSEPSILTSLAELAAVAIANAENKAKLTASRARVVATADETRRRVQRDVHDGAQQRLVHTVITLKLAQNTISPGDDAVALVDEALLNAERASNELRDLVRGILPAALTSGGLRAGLESLAGDLALPVDVHVTAPRLPAPMETTAYFVVAEALTNVVKHAHATRAAVDVTVDGEMIRIDVRDDGVGGADPSRGSGLLGLFDRIDAAEGTFTITSPPGFGTALEASLPLR